MFYYVVLPIFCLKLGAASAADEGKARSGESEQRPARERREAARQEPERDREEAPRKALAAPAELTARPHRVADAHPAAQARPSVARRRATAGSGVRAAGRSGAGRAPAGPLPCPPHLAVERALGQASDAAVLQAVVPGRAAVGAGLRTQLRGGSLHSAGSNGGGGSRAEDYQGRSLRVSRTGNPVKKRSQSPAAASAGRGRRK